MEVCGPEALWELSWDADPSLDPTVLLSETLGLGPETCSFSGSIPGVLVQVLWSRGSFHTWTDSALKGIEQSQGEKYLVYHWNRQRDKFPGQSSNIAGYLTAEGKRQKTAKLKWSAIWASQSHGRETAILQHGHTLLAPKRSSKSLWSFDLVFLLRKPRSPYIKKEDEEINGEQTFPQKLTFHRVKGSCIPFKIFPTITKYKGLLWLGVA